MYSGMVQAFSIHGSPVPSILRMRWSLSYDCICSYIRKTVEEACIAVLMRSYSSHHPHLRQRQLAGSADLLQRRKHCLRRHRQSHHLSGCLPHLERTAAHKRADRQCRSLLDRILVSPFGIRYHPVTLGDSPLPEGALQSVPQRRSCAGCGLLPPGRETWPLRCTGPLGSPSGRAVERGSPKGIRETERGFVGMTVPGRPPRARGIYFVNIPSLQTASLPHIPNEKRTSGSVPMDRIRRFFRYFSRAASRTSEMMRLEIRKPLGVRL